MTKIELVSTGSLKKACLKIVSSVIIHDTTRVGHDNLIPGNQHSQYLKMHKKQPETRKQVRLENDRRFKRQKSRKFT